MYGLASWADPAATMIALGVLAVAAAALYLLGLRLLVAVGGLYFLRPPAYRDPMPSPPEALFARLPAALGCSEDLNLSRTFVENVDDAPAAAAGAGSAGAASPRGPGRSGGGGGADSGVAASPKGAARSGGGGGSGGGASSRGDGGARSQPPGRGAGEAASKAAAGTAA